MNKQDFLTRLREALSGLPQEDIDERLMFYGEMIDDKVEDGLPEEDAVAEIGSVEAIASQFLEDFPLPKIVKERMKPKRRLRVWEIVLLILGSPAWLPLLVAAFSVFLSVYVVIWSVIISLWAVDVSFAAGFLGGIIGGVILLCLGEGTQGFLMICAGLILAGMAVFLFFGCKLVTKGALLLTKKIALAVKFRFLRKENA